jgi:Recombination endonuclease VII
MKTCIKCTRNLSDQNFYVKRYKNGTIGLRSYCIDCGVKQRNEWRKQYKEKDNARNSAYNKEHAHIIRANKIKVYWPGTNWHEAAEKYKAMKDSQDGVCAICSRPERRQHLLTKTTWDLAIDHCHETGMVRGLLCNACNRGLGLLGDKVETLEKVLLYLKNHLEDK